jgi:nitrite reductase (NADH) large subunit
MDATRAGMGCGSCKALVTEIVQWACGGETEEDPSVHYYVPGVPLTKPDLIRAIQEHNLRSVSAVFDLLAGGKEDAASKASKPGLASLLKTLWHEEYQDERDARFINERIHANIQKDGTFSVMRKCQVAWQPSISRIIFTSASRWQAWLPVASAP